MRSSLATVLVASVWLSQLCPAATPAPLVQNSDFMQQSADKKSPVGYELAGDARWQYLGDKNRDSAVAGVAFHSETDLNHDGKISGEVAQTIHHLDSREGRWFHFTFRGLPHDGFKVGPDGLWMKADYFTNDGKNSADGKIKKLDGIVQQARRDLTTNGDLHIGGAAVWRTYAMDFWLPFESVDTVRLSVGFNSGAGDAKLPATFDITDFELTRIDGPASGSPAPNAATARPDGRLIPLGGRWFYRAGDNETQPPAQFNAANADRLYYHDVAWTTPFLGTMNSTLRAGDLDLNGNLVTADRPAPDNVTVAFDSTSMIIHTRGLPNHPTGKFPETNGNPSHIQEQDATYYIPLNPMPNPRHFVTAIDNSNHALPMGPIGIAANGIVFFNPFDATSQDASSFMDRCCGHPNPMGTYHYHKYPICINSPWADEGNEPSPLIGWAFDGYPIYGPYEKAGVMAKDATGEGA